MLPGISFNVSITDPWNKNRSVIGSFQYPTPYATFRADWKLLNPDPESSFKEEFIREAEYATAAAAPSVIGHKVTSNPAIINNSLLVNSGTWVRQKFFPELNKQFLPDLNKHFMDAHFIDTMPISLIRNEREARPFWSLRSRLTLPISLQLPSGYFYKSEVLTCPPHAPQALSKSYCRKLRLERIVLKR
jgi:hypothetical protein